jgi:transposase
MNEQKKRSYTPEFKKDAVRLVTEQGYKVTEAARNLGINPSVLQRWKTELASVGPNAFPGKGRLSPEQEELQRLRKENQRLRMEREILKKAAAFFANESK